MRRAVMALAIATGLAIGTAIPTAAIGETQVRLSCSDGTSTALVVDPETLTGLTQAIQAMVAYPAGLTCTLVKVPLLGFGMIALASPGQSPFIVGGGRWQVTCESIGLGGGGGGGFGALPAGTVARVAGSWSSLGSQTDDLVWVNIAVNAHQKDDGTVFGTLNETIPANQSCPGGPVGESHFTSTPTCVSILGSTAFVTSLVTQTSGQRPFPADTAGSVNLGDYVHFGFQDNGNPSQGTDFLDGPPETPTGNPDQTCTADINPAPLSPLLNGNISIRNS